MGLTSGGARSLFGDSDVIRLNMVRSDSQRGYRLGGCEAPAGSLVISNVYESFGGVVSDHDF